MYLISFFPSFRIGSLPVVLHEQAAPEEEAQVAHGVHQPPDLRAGEEVPLPKVSVAGGQGRNRGSAWAFKRSGKKLINSIEKHEKVLYVIIFQVITWFQNRRAKLKRDMEELRKDVECSPHVHAVAAAAAAAGHQHVAAAVAASIAARNMSPGSAGPHVPAGADSMTAAALAAAAQAHVTTSAAGGVSPRMLLSPHHRMAIGPTPPPPPPPAATSLSSAAGASAGPQSPHSSSAAASPLRSSEAGSPQIRVTDSDG